MKLLIIVPFFSIDSFNEAVKENIDIAIKLHPEIGDRLSRRPEGKA